MGLHCANDDLALHISVRFVPQTIVLNSRQNGAWGQEVVLPIGGLAKNSECDLAVSVKKEKFVIGLNGKLHGEFGHRLPKEHISGYEIGGGFDISSIKFPWSLDINLSGVLRKPKKAGRGDGSVSFV